MVNGKTNPGNGHEQQEQFVQREEDEGKVEAELISPAQGATDEDDAGDVGQLRDEIASLSEKAQEHLDLAQRTQAEMENLRKRTARDIENAHKYALERFVADLLPVIDSLELGIQASDSAGDVTTLREGMDLTLKKFIDSLGKFGITAVNPEGEKFNPEKHDAVSMAVVEGADPGTVISVLQKGYELNGRLVRPSMVVVAGGGQPADNGDSDG